MTKRIRKPNRSWKAPPRLSPRKERALSYWCFDVFFDRPKRKYADMYWLSCLIPDERQQGGRRGPRPKEVQV